MVVGLRVPPKVPRQDASLCQAAEANLAAAAAEVGPLNTWGI